MIINIKWFEHTVYHISRALKIVVGLGLQRLLSTTVLDKKTQSLSGLGEQTRAIEMEPIPIRELPLVAVNIYAVQKF